MFISNPQDLRNDGNWSCDEHPELATTTADESPIPRSWETGDCNHICSDEMYSGQAIDATAHTDSLSLTPPSTSDPALRGSSSSDTERPTSSESSAGTDAEVLNTRQPPPPAAKSTKRAGSRKTASLCDVCQLCKTGDADESVLMIVIRQIVDQLAQTRQIKFLYTIQESAEIMGIKKTTLDKYRRDGRGPVPFRPTNKSTGEKRRTKHSLVLYSLWSLIMWILENSDNDDGCAA